jgi:heme/copper-type cytochrome/quinol oxidase subunit 4
MYPTLNNERELYFERGGPSYRLMQRIGLVLGDGPSVWRRIIGFLALTWLPLLILCLLEGRALGATPEESLLLDFASYARFFIAMPLLIVAEVLIGPILTAAGTQFIEGGFVRKQDYPAFDRAIARVAQRRESLWAEVILMGLALIGAWAFTVENLAGTTATWNSAFIGGPAGPRPSFAGLWYHVIAVPLLQFLFYRWLWRLLIWFQFLFTVSRLNLNVVATHSDQAGGLGFLGIAHASFGVFAFALSAVLSADAAFRIVFHGAAIETFKLPLVILLVVTQIAILGPLLVFVPLLGRTRREWLRSYSLLVVRYNRTFHEKWIDGSQPEGELLLGNPDMQSLADLGGSFEFIRAMRIAPFNQRTVVQLAVITALPGLPLLLLVVPIEKVLDTLGGALL